MRLLFSKGKQKELIQSFKCKTKLTWEEVSNLLKIKQGALLSYYYEKSLLPEDIYRKLDKTKKYKQFIAGRKEEGWGRIKGGKLSPGKTKEISMPEESEELAEFYGVMLGDGNSSRIKGYKIGTYLIRIVGDSRKDRKYLIDYIGPLIKRLFNINVRIGYFKQTNAMLIEAHSKKLVDFLERRGFKPGNKIKNKLNIPNWIKINPLFLKACLRGLYDTDGSAYKLTNQNSHQINFSNRNILLLQDVRKALISFNILPSNITKGKEFNITKKSELRKFLKLVGFHNFKHLNKVKVWKIAL